MDCSASSSTANIYLKTEKSEDVFSDDKIEEIYSEINFAKKFKSFGLTVGGNNIIDKRITKLGEQLKSHHLASSKPKHSLTASEKFPERPEPSKATSNSSGTGVRSWGGRGVWSCQMPLLRQK